MNRKTIFIMICIVIISFILRLPPSSSKLAGYDQIQIFHNGLQLLQTSFTDFNELYKNTIVRLTLYNYHGISNISLSVLNAFIFQFTNIPITWWNYFFIYHLFSSLTVLFLFLILKEITGNIKLSLLSASVWALTPSSVVSAMRPCWAPFSTLFSLLLLFILILYPRKKSLFLIFSASFILALIILGDLTFMINLLLVIILIFIQKKQNSQLWSFKKIVWFSILPVTALLINLFSTLLSLYKGYHIGLLGYIIGHKAQIKPVDLLHSYADFFQGLFWSNGIVLFIFILFFFLIIPKLKKNNFYQRLIFIWAAILLIPTLLLRRDDLTITLLNLPLTILGCLFIMNRDFSEKRKTIILTAILILQTPFLFNIKYSIFPIPDHFYKTSYQGEISDGHEDYGQMASGCWIEDNVPKNDSILVITPYTEKNFITEKTKFHMKEMYYLLSTGLYGKKVYTQCKGLADKKIFSLCNLFSYLPNYKIDSPPKYLIDYSNSNQIHSLLHQFIPDSIQYEKIGEIYNNRTIQITLYSRTKSLTNIQKYDKNDLEKHYLKNYSTINHYTYSPYQGLWFFLP